MEIIQRTIIQLNQTEGERRAKQRKRNRLKRQSLTKQITNITNAIAETGHTRALLEKLEKLESEHEALLIEARTLDTETPPYEPLSKDDLATLSEKIIAQLETANPEQIRAILRGFIKKIRVQKKDGAIIGTITYYYPFNGTSLPISQTPVGAPLHRQAFTCQIIRHPMRC